MQQNIAVLIMDVSTSTPISIYPIISEDIANLKTADKNAMQTINTIVIL